MNSKPGRNEACNCGSGKKYKRCCGQDRTLGAAPAELNQLLALAAAARYPDAEARARSMLLRFPNSAPVWRALSLALWMQGKDAIQALEMTAQLLPNDADAHGNLGTALRARGRLSDAVRSYRRSLEIAPEFAESHNNLGSAYRDLGQLENAVASYRRALALKPEFAVAQCNLGHALRILGHIADAAAHYRRAIEIQPDFADAHTGLGASLQDLGQFDQALKSHRYALTLTPQAAASHRNLGAALLDCWRFDEAEACFRRALELDPMSAEAHGKLGVALRLNRRSAEAEESCRRALELDPTLIDALISSAQLLADRGEFAQAEVVLNRAIVIEPESAEAWAGIAGLRKMTAGDSGWAAAAQRIAGNSLAPRREARLRYAVGKYCDDVGDFAQAFMNYRRANELSKCGTGHDRHETTREFDRIIERHDRRWLDERRVGENTSTRPVLIVGMPRSGTTLTEQILGAHPAVFAAGELPFWVPASKKYASTPHGGEIAADMLGRLGRDYLHLLSGQSATALRVADKMPGNFECLGLIHAALPNARIIHISRDPIDTCLSIYFQDFNSTHTYANDLGDLAHHYGEYLRLMKHWRGTLPEGSILDVAYEDLVENQEERSRRMLEFIGLSWDPQCLDFNRHDRASRTIMTFSKWQARQKITRSSVGRWRNYEKFIGPLLKLTAADSRAADSCAPVN